MTTMTVMPRETEWTVDDLDAIPDDGLQYELLDGILLVSPAPVPKHQRAVGRIYSHLIAACPPELEAFVSPLDWRPDRSTSLQPDVLVVRRPDIGELNISAPLVLAVEVVSPSSRRKDRVLKLSKYAECSVASYWIVDPDRPSCTAYDLHDGAYVESGQAVSDEVLTVERPFPLTLSPVALVDPRA